MFKFADINNRDDHVIANDTISTVYIYMYTCVTVACGVLSVGSVFAGYRVVVVHVTCSTRPVHGAVSTGAYKGRESQV